MLSMLQPVQFELHGALYRGELCHDWTTAKSKNNYIFNDDQGVFLSCCIWEMIETKFKQSTIS